MQAVVPGVLSSSSPKFLDGTGMTTSALYVQDLAFWLPLMAVSAVWLWRRQAWGYVIAGAMLVTYEIEAVGVAVDQWMGHAADPASPVAWAAAVPIFTGIAIIGLIPLAVYFRSLDRGQAPGKA
jgi:ABC-type maltose transport system permease subunit